jgi:formylglycine-generating enzyme required for sulfatase activity
MMTTEVTQAMWEAVTGYTIEEQRDRAHPSRMIYGAGPTWPVHYVSWPDCHEFIDLLNRMDGACTYRLPTEAEWEYACRAGSEASYYWGDDAVVIGDYCWTVSNSGYRMQPVGQLAPNAWGLYDMLGNALEMCEDQYHPGYTGAPSDGSAWVDGDPSDFRISRGGSFDLGESVCTCFRRFYETPGERQHYLGFRLVRIPG